MIATLVVALAIPLVVSQYDRLIAFYFPKPVVPSATKIRPQGVRILSGQTKIWPQTLGVVLRVRRSLVAISLGTEDGLEIGQTVRFRRDGVIVGFGKITKSKSNMSACAITDGEIIERDHVEVEILGDVNCDGSVDLLDVSPFIDLITSGEFESKADINQDGAVDLLDVGSFVDLLTSG